MNKLQVLSPCQQLTFCRADGC